MDNMTGLKRTHYCGDLRSENIGSEVIVSGWVAKQRDLGSLIFIDLRDRTGIVQLAFDDSTDKEIFDKAFTVRSEFVLMAKGTVRERSSKNMDIPTGEVEISAIGKLNNGSSSVEHNAIITGVMPDDYVAKEVIVTNTIPLNKNFLPEKITQLSVAPLLGEAISRIHDDESVSSLFGFEKEMQVG